MEKFFFLLHADKSKAAKSMLMILIVFKIEKCYMMLGFTNLDISAQFNKKSGDY